MGAQHEKASRPHEDVVNREVRLGASDRTTTLYSQYQSNNGYYCPHLAEGAVVFAKACELGPLRVSCWAASIEAGQVATG
jgi:hypothetical protein